MIDLNKYNALTSHVSSSEPVKIFQIFTGSCMSNLYGISYFVFHTLDCDW